MKNLNHSCFLDGFADELEKLGEDNPLFSMPSGAIFPTSRQQAKWRFARGDGFLRLSNGMNSFHFDLPSNHGEESFDVKRHADPQLNEFDSGATSKGLAQVHRSDPGSIYFTLQEGYRNPTYTLFHVGGDTWRALPKKQKRKLDPATAQQPVTSTIPNIQHVKQAMEDELEKLGTSALAGLINGTQSLAMYPGRNWETPWAGVSGGLGAAGLGAGLGAAYHFGRRKLYNTPEENAEEDEQGPGLVAKRIGLPAAALGLTSAAQGVLAPKYYEDVASGNNTFRAAA